ncbi:uncharacterized protein BXZ73DRAFT_100280 [Epithele typhae]|uniref:uncharacterized protein n=1 Tax=Epithele typhae TaxID=378194 RepID=UPI0020073A43|nr:uncharacterized protein BXZ73DRAFT_100280 [Epithele typhae]KAH9936865.1 hypothetical protein BXZ73DRAFT_100280 [Epithele typhae]
MTSFPDLLTPPLLAQFDAAELAANNPTENQLFAAIEHYFADKTFDEVVEKDRRGGSNSQAKAAANLDGYAQPGPELVRLALLSVGLTMVPLPPGLANLSGRTTSRTLTSRSDESSLGHLNVLNPRLPLASILSPLRMAIKHRALQAQWNPPISSLHFPIDVVENFIDVLGDRGDHTALAQCIRVCKSWFPRSRYRLWHRLVISRGDQLPAICSAFARDTSLRSLVQIVRLHGTPGSDVDKPGPLPIAAIVVLLPHLGHITAWEFYGRISPSICVWTLATSSCELHFLRHHDNTITRFESKIYATALRQHSSPEREDHRPRVVAICRHGTLLTAAVGLPDAVTTIPPPGDFPTIHRASFSSDGTRLLVTGDSPTPFRLVLDTLTGATIAGFDGGRYHALFRGVPTAAELSGDGQVAVIESEGSGRGPSEWWLWRLEDGTPHRVLNREDRQVVRKCALSRDGRVAGFATKEGAAFFRNVDDLDLGSDPVSVIW